MPKNPNSNFPSDQPDRSYTRRSEDVPFSVAFNMAAENIAARATIRRLRERNSNLADAAVKDPLTGLFNRRGLEEFYRSMQAGPGNRHQEGEPPHPSLLLIDVDKFKQVNDTAGHAGGDVYLKRIAEVMTESTRPRDIRSRTGGDEFAILLARTDVEEALIVAERIRHGVASISRIGHTAIEASVSIGVGLVNLDQSLEDNVDYIDQALYAAKDAGRNKVILAASEF